MPRRSLGLLLVLIGLGLIALSLLADMIGIGAQAGIIGWKQILGAAAGLIIAGAGARMALRRGDRGAA